MSGVTWHRCSLRARADASTQSLHRIWAGLIIKKRLGNSLGQIGGEGKERRDLAEQLHASSHSEARRTPAFRTGLAVASQQQGHPCRASSWEVLCVMVRDSANGVWAQSHFM